MTEPIRFPDWTPVFRDRSVGYSYLVPRSHRSGRGLRKVTQARGSWEHAKARVALSALRSGVEEFKVWGGIGAHRWQHTVVVSRLEAEAYLREQGGYDVVLATG